MVGRVFEDGEAGRRRLLEAHAGLDHHREDLPSEAPADLLEHLLGVQGAPVVHRHEDAADLEVAVQLGPDPLYRLEEETEAPHGQVFALEGHYHVARGDEGDGEETEGRRTVYEDEVVAIADG